MLRYHSVPCLRTNPPVAWDPVLLEDDPVPFIRLRPPPGTVAIELGILRPGRPTASGRAADRRRGIEPRARPRLHGRSEPCHLATTDPATGPDFDRHFRRAVWITALITVIAAGMIYADKADDDRSAFIRWRPQVLEFWQGTNIYATRMYPNPPIMPITLYPLMTLPPLRGALAWFALKAA